MKRHLLWTFDRGSYQWDILCLLILAFLFLPLDFNEVPEFMKVSATETVHKTVDKNGTMIYTIKLEEPCFFDTDNTRMKAEAMLEKTLGEHVKRGRTQPIRNRTGRLIAYAMWQER